MADDQQDLNLFYSQQLRELRLDVLRLRASIGVLKAALVAAISPENPESVLKEFALREEQIFAADPLRSINDQVLDTVDALRQLKKRGGSGEPDA